MDLLADVLSNTRIRGTVFGRMALDAPWGIHFEATEGAVFHAVVGGQCWLQPFGGEAMVLRQGDTVLLPRGAGHRLIHQPGQPTVLAQDFFAKVPPSVAPATILLCGAYKFEIDGRHPLLASLPPVIRVSRGESHQSLTFALGLLEAEHLVSGPGGRAAIHRLVDLAFIYLVRSWLERQPEGEGGWLSAAKDPRIGRVLVAIHENPGNEWDVDTLANLARMSRAAFSRKFHALVGEPPQAYVTRCRMTYACRILRETDFPVALVASRVGYGSEFAFSKAFRRALGLAPIQYRASRREESAA